MRLIPTILCGGAGSRLWPVSREMHPKPFIRLADGQSLLQKAFLRGAVLPGATEVLTITNRELLFKTKDDFSEVNPRALPTSFVLEQTVPGRAAHASQRREGVSALDKLFVLVQALEADETRRNAAETDPLMTALGLPYPTIIGIVGGGEWASTVLDRVTADGRYGVRLGQSAADAEVELRAAIAAACAADEFLRDHPATIEIHGGRFGSARVASDHPLPVGLAETVEAVTGRRPALLGEPYGADMQMFVNAGGTPCVIFGPGDVKVAHCADEHVPLAEVVDCARVLAVWLRRELVGRTT